MSVILLVLIFYISFFPFAWEVVNENDRKQEDTSIGKEVKYFYQFIDSNATEISPAIFTPTVITTQKLEIQKSLNIVLVQCPLNINPLISLLSQILCHPKHKTITLTYRWDVAAKILFGFISKI